MLTDFGAEVIKVERPGSSNDSRSHSSPFAGGEAGQTAGEFGFLAHRKCVENAKYVVIVRGVLFPDFNAL
jgi:crotonobetainyl-CoA:carnitine CoA-transferase CaiB-like acyl-CoA transferase